MKKILMLILVLSMVLIGTVGLCADNVPEEEHENKVEGIIYLQDGTRSPVQINKGSSVGQHIITDGNISSFYVYCPSWSNNIGNLTITLYAWSGDYDSTVASEPLARKTYENYNDNTWLEIGAPEGKAFAKGEFLWTLTDPVETVGIWKAAYDNMESPIVQESFTNGKIISGCFYCGVKYAAEGAEIIETGVVESTPDEGKETQTPTDIKAEDSENVIMYVDAPKAFVKGEEKALDVPPVVVNGRTLLPARFVAESIGAKVDWYEETQTVAIEKGDLLVTLVIGSSEMRVNGEVTILDVPAQTINDRTVVPLRAICEALGQQVNYFPDGDKGLIVVGENAESFDKNVADAFIKLYK